MQMSEKVDQIFQAIIAAQSQVENAHKDAENPHFRSTYASLHGIRLISKPVLAENGLAIINVPCSSEDYTPGVNLVVIHKSGQWLSEECYIRLAKVDPQTVGSFHTYMRRYNENGILGIVADEDDDGNAASGKQKDSEKMSISTVTGNSFTPPVKIPQPPKPAMEPTKPYQPSGKKVPGKLITEKQQKFFHVAIKNAGWTNNEAHHFMRAKYGIEHVGDFTMDNFKDFTELITYRVYGEAIAAFDQPANHFGDVPPLTDQDVPF